MRFVSDFVNLRFFSSKMQRRRRDSNPRPLDPQSSALGQAELRPVYKCLFSIALWPLASLGF